MTGNQALVAAIARLRSAGVPQPPRDARLLLAHALGIEHTRLTLVLPEELPKAALSDYETAIARREARQPVSHITGGREFYGRHFNVTPDVLDPRPETELLVDLALAGAFQDLLDLGTGSGCILLSLLAERPQARGTGSDMSQTALKIAGDNAAALGLADRATFLPSDWFQMVTGEFDLIVSNPPYIAEREMANLSPEVRGWEPHLALTPGGDGLAAYRAITAGAVDHLRPGGRILVEIGHRQGRDVASLFTAAGLSDVQVHKDLAGHDRVVSGHCRRNLS